MNRLSTRLAAQAHQAQATTLARLNAAGVASDRAVGRLWQRLLKVLKGPRTDYAGNHYRAWLVLRRVAQTAVYVLYKHLSQEVKLAHAEVAKSLADVLPAGYHTLHFDLREDEGDTARDLFLKLLFPPPSEAFVNRVVFGTDWVQRLTTLSRLAPPETLATIVAQGMMLGKSQRDIAKELLPHVEGVRASARRVARTEGIRVAHHVQMEAYNALGDLVIGYTVHATFDENTRPWHRARSGTTYYKEPGPGQKGYHQMPRPPEEAPDPAERPPRTPQVAPNCRCYLVPLLRPLKQSRAIATPPLR